MWEFLLRGKSFFLLGPKARDFNLLQVTDISPSKNTRLHSVSSGAAASSLAKAVQELAINTSAPPENYIRKEGIGGSSSEFPYLDIPVLDLSLLNSSSPEAEEELKRLRLAFSSCGYF
ncbi:Iron/ascorbate family oxidoreductase [Abeliophyllum distichum]|uniref:Iron/ascorbate family oxidoreductase n=1 Tax=Abeliophyllum distichum TaxID=126358 RepID=A0ABD1TY08_9LAMI